MATESSVVVALREVRRLELERQRREEEARVRREQEESEAARRSSIQYGQELSPIGWNGGQNGDAQPESYVQQMRRTSEVVPLGGRANGFHEPHPYVNMPGPTTWEAPPPVQTSRSGTVFKTFFVTVLLCAGGAAFGYVKLNQKFETEKVALVTERKMAEDARNDGVAARSKTEQELKVQISQLETKLATAVARAGAASAALNQAAAVANANMSKAAPLPGGKAPRAGLVRGRPGRLAAVKARAAAAKAEPMLPPAPAAKTPKVAKKKAVSDDPLGGLRL
jgi:hypothetical protein